MGEGAGIGASFEAEVERGSRQEEDEDYDIVRIKFPSNKEVRFEHWKAGNIVSCWTVDRS